MPANLSRYTNVSENDRFHVVVKYVVWNCVRAMYESSNLASMLSLVEKMFCPLINTSSHCQAQFPHIHLTNKVQYFLKIIIICY